MTPVRSKPALLMLMLAVCMLAPGCVRRTVHISTVPEGATVVLNDEEVGTSPLSMDFTWYGNYDVIVRHEGYQTLNTNHVIKRPWYEVAPIDFVTEALMPFTIHDEHTMHFELVPAEPVDRAELLEAAEQLRDRALYEEE